MLAKATSSYAFYVAGNKRRTSLYPYAPPHSPRTRPIPLPPTETGKVAHNRMELGVTDRQTDTHTSNENIVSVIPPVYMYLAEIINLFMGRQQSNKIVGRARMYDSSKYSFQLTFVMAVCQTTLWTMQYNSAFFWLSFCL